MRRQNSAASRKKSKVNRFALCALLLSALLLFSLVRLEQKMRPVARTMAEYECREAGGALDAVCGERLPAPVA